MINIKEQFKSELISIENREPLNKDFDIAKVKINYQKLEEMIKDDTKVIFKNVDSDELALFIERQIYDYLHNIYDYSLGC